MLFHCPSLLAHRRLCDPVKPGRFREAFCFNQIGEYFEIVDLHGDGIEMELLWYLILGKIKEKNNISQYWNLNKAEEIAPSAFKIPTSVIKTDKRLKYENFLIKNMVPYCGKAPGKYKEPSAFLINGKPTTNKRLLQYYPGAEKILWEEYKAGKTKKPPGMSLEEYQFELYGNYIGVSKSSISYQIPYEEFSNPFPFEVVCSTKISDKTIFDYSEKNKKIVISENIRFNSEETVTYDYYNCRKWIRGVDVYGTVIWGQPVRKNTYGELYLNTLCEKLNKWKN